MADTNIDWADKVWNPVTGCTKVSAGCKHCYAESMANRLQAMGSKGYENGFGTVVCHEDRLKQPLHWRKPRRIFVNSMGDLFHDDVPFEFVNRVFAVMALSSQHEFIILTKRPERMLEYLSSRLLEDHICHIMDQPTWVALPRGRSFPRYFDEWPLPNVIPGVSISNQGDADKFIPWLLQTPAAKRIVSYEPVLELVDFKDYMIETYSVGWNVNKGNKSELLVPKIDLVIMGGESGFGARPMHPDWARNVRDQCKAAGVPFYFKQMSGVRPKEVLIPADLAVREWPE